MIIRALPLVMLLLLATPEARAQAQVSERDPSSAADGPLNFHVQAAFDYESFDICLRELEKLTGLPVTCARDIEALVRAEWAKGKIPWVYQPTLTRYPTPVTKCLDAVAGDLQLVWKYQPESRSILLDVPWRREDARPAKELLAFVMQHEPESADRDFKMDAPWCDAFHALLCRGANFARALEVREKAFSESFFFAFGRPWLPPMDAVLRSPVVDVDGHRYLLVLVVQKMIFSPDSGYAHYYWFNEDGSLAGAGIMNTGHRVWVSGATMETAAWNPPGQASVILLDSRFNGSGNPFAARFVLGRDGLQSVNFVDAAGNGLENMYQIGGSLLAPKDPPGKGAPPADKGSYTIQLPTEVDASKVMIVTCLSRPMAPGDFGLQKLNLQARLRGHDCRMATDGATRLKAVVFVNGQQTALIDEHPLKPDTAQATTPELEPLAATSFAGRIDFPAGAEPAQYRVEVTYYGTWITRYLEAFSWNGPPPVPAVSIDLAADGSFTGSVPDLVHDPVVGAHLEGSALTVMLKDKRTGRVPYELKVDGTAGSDLTLRENYDGLQLHAIAWSPVAR